MLTYKNIMSNFIAIETAISTNDDNDIISRLYNNDVEVHYTINKNTMHILYIESYIKNKGNASTIIRELINEFNNYDIIIDALFYLEKWYATFGFEYQYSLDDMLCFRMINKVGDKFDKV